VGVAAVLVCLAVPASASAAQIVAGPAPVAYQNPNIEIDPGEEVTFMNLDVTAPHDVTSIDPGPGGTALFSSATVGFLTTVPVVGADKLDPGTYDYICSIHSFMTGAITVRGGGGSGGAPSLRLRALDREVDEVADAGKLRLRAKLSEAARVSVVATAGRAKVAYGAAKLPKGGGTLKAKLTSKGKRLLGNAKRVSLTLKGRATDADGNTAKHSTELTLR
jgi:plastocyanin